MSKPFAPVIIIVMAILLSGCMNQGIISNPDAVQRLDAEKPVELVFWHTYSDEETRVFENELLPRFHEAHPDIAVKAVRVWHTNELRSSLIARATSGKPPDVVRMDIAWVPQFSSMGLLVPVSRFPDFPQVKKRLHSVAMQIGYYNGGYYGLPLNMNTKAAIFNKNLLDQAGITSPPNSLEQIFQLAEKIHSNVSMGGPDPWSSLPFFYALGGSLTNSDYTKASGYLNSPRSIAALQKMVDMYKKGVLTLSLPTDPQDRMHDVMNGNMLMIDEGPWFYSILQNSKEESIDAAKATIAAPFPFDNGNASILGGEHLVILKGTRHAEQAWTFMKWLTDQQAQTLMYKAGMIPTNLEAYRSLDDLTGSAYIKAYVEGLDHAFLRPPVRNWEKAEKVYTDFMTQIFVEQEGVEKAANEAAGKLDALLSMPEASAP